MKIYLGGPMFTYAEVSNNLRLAEKLRDNGFEVYCPNENDSINDKTRTDITAEKVYLADVKELESANVFLCQVAEDSGTMWEAGYMDCLSKYVDSKKIYRSDRLGDGYTSSDNAGSSKIRSGQSVYVS